MRMQSEHATERLLSQDELEPEVVLAENADDTTIELLDESPTPEPSVNDADTSDLDLLSLYLEQTSREALLSREQEVELARTIENAARSRASTVLASPLGLGVLQALADGVRSGAIGATEVCGDDARLDEPSSDASWFRRTFLVQVRRVTRLAQELHAVRARGRSLRPWSLAAGGSRPSSRRPSVGSPSRPTTSIASRPRCGRRCRAARCCLHGSTRSSAPPRTRASASSNRTFASSCGSRAATSIAGCRCST